ncbi:MAG: DUF255 domain-containing protein [Fimbriimonas sp.]
MPNRLEGADSPYLRQHANNPVDWYPWGPEAFGKAQAENKPIFLSVGYSSCHWCHVMEHESFEDEQVAALMNGTFVNIKVDREERPDIDDAYMTAVQLYSGRGGWPMTVILTPEGKPFFAGTYFPKEDRGQHPGMLSLCAQIGNMWKSRNSEIRAEADRFALAIREAHSRTAPGTFAKFDRAFLDGLVAKVMADFDPEHGGFGGAPKFPPHTAIELLLGYCLDEEANPELAENAFTVSLATLQHMAFGGIHDHVGGGFHRYSTDREWLLPHFEKMLYDNVLLLGNYAKAAALTSQMAPPLSQQFSSVVAGILMWLQREMTSPEGLLYSAVDADSEGEEGKFYLWSMSEVREALGEKAEAFMEAYGFALAGNFADEATGERNGANIPHLATDVAGQFDDQLDLLLAIRNQRVRPALDDKSLIGWNGLAVAAYAEAGLAHEAERIAIAVLAAEEKQGSLPHQVVGARPSGEGFLEDYAYVADGLFQLAKSMQTLHEMAGEGLPPFANVPTHYFAHAERLTAQMIERFYDDERGGFFSTSDRHEELFGRSKPFFDQPLPSPIARALRCLTAIGDDVRAERTVQASLGWVEKAPGATEALILAMMPYLEYSEAVAVAPKPVGVPVLKVAPREVAADSNGKGTLTVSVEIPEGLHLNSSNPPARWLTPTKVEVNGLRATIAYPDATNDRYETQLEIKVEIELPSGKRDAEFEVVVSYQACTETECQEPVRRAFGCVIMRD